MSTLPDTMAGVQLIGPGGPEQLRWQPALPLPRPGPGQILVRVRAAGVNNIDINTRLDWYANAGFGDGHVKFPRIQGADLCGEVAALGKGVAGPAIGTRVTAMSVQDCSEPDHPKAMVTLGSDRDGAFADYCLLAADQVFDVSASPLSDVEIGAMPCAFGAAWNMIERAGITKDDDLFVTGASGGVGLAVVMLAHDLGANIIAQTTPAKADAVRKAGATRIIQRSETPAPGSCSAWIDMVGGPEWGKHLAALRPGGRIALAGAIAGPVTKADLRLIYLRDLTIFGCTHQPRTTFQGLIDRINAGRIRPLVSRSYALRDIAKAQNDFTTKRFPGKLVLIP